MGVASTVSASPLGITKGHKTLWLKHCPVRITNHPIVNGRDSQRRKDSFWIDVEPDIESYVIRSADLR